MISDPIEFELFKNSLFSIADEMALTIFRTTYSGVLKDGLLDRDVRRVGQIGGAEADFARPSRLDADGDGGDPEGLRDTLWALIERNVRVPVKVFGDLRAQLAACHISERSLIELAGHYGVEKVGQYMTELIDYSERMTRAAIRELPDGVCSFLDHIDDDGIDRGSTKIKSGHLRLAATDGIAECTPNFRAS